MTTITPLPRRLDGSLDLPGANDLTLLDIDFGPLTAIPSSVTVGTTGGASGAMTGTPPTAALRLTTGSASGNQASASLPAVDTSLYEYILFTMDATAPAAGYPGQIYFGLEAGSQAGATWRRLEGTMNSRGGDTAVGAGAMFQASGRPKKQQVSLLLIPSKKIVATLDAGGVNNAAIFPGFVGGSILPKVTIQTNSAAVCTFDVRRFRVRVGL